MATIEWYGTGTAVAQIVDITIGGVLAGEDFIIYVNGETIASHTDTTTVINDTRDALIAAWNASTNPYVYASSLLVQATSGGAGIVRLTSQVAGLPFVVTLNTPGGAATFGQSEITASAGPYDLSTTANYSGGALPGNGDTFIVPQGSGAIRWNLDALSGVTLAKLEIVHGCGIIGLRSDQFHQSEDATTTVTSSRREYRTTALTVGATILNIGRTMSTASSAPTGASLIKVDTEAVATTTKVLGGALQTAAYAPIQLFFNHANSELFLRGTCAVGVEADQVGDSGQLSAIYQESATSNLVVGAGCTLGTMDITGGYAILRNAPGTLLRVASGASAVLTGTGTIPVVRGSDQVTVDGSYEFTESE